MQIQSDSTDSECGGGSFLEGREKEEEEDALEPVCRLVSIAYRQIAFSFLFTTFSMLKKNPEAAEPKKAEEAIHFYGVVAFWLLLEQPFLFLCSSTRRSLRNVDDDDSFQLPEEALKER